MSVIFSQAVRAWHELRAEYENLKLAAYARAEEECAGKLLNRRGEAAGIDSYSLFSGNETRARAYASEELLEHWESNPRTTFAAFERALFESEAA